MDESQKHGNWLNMAEIELHTLNRKCLNRKIGHIEALKQEVRFWQQNKKNKNAKIDWQFTNDNVKIKLKNYPILLD